MRVAALVVRDGRLLAVEHAKDGRRYHLLPGGGVDDGETLERALERELAEEIGVRATVGPLMAVSLSSAPSDDRHIVQMVFRTHISGVPRTTGQDARVVGVRWLGPRQLGASTFRPDLRRWLRGHLASGRARAGTPCLRVPWVA